MAEALKLYYIERRDVWTWDDFDAAVVAAVDAEQACRIIPQHSDNRPNGHGESPLGINSEPAKLLPDAESPWFGWTSDPANVIATYIGEAASEIDSPRVICASFNAG